MTRGTHRGEHEFTRINYDIAVANCLSWYKVMIDRFFSAIVQYIDSTVAMRTDCKRCRASFVV